MMSHDPVFRIGDVIVWKNKNTNTVEEGKVHSIVDSTVAIGDHYVSWVSKGDVQVLEYKERGKDKKGSYWQVA